MWIILNNAFLSVVATASNDDTLVVRARKRQDILNVFPNARIVALPKRDYQYRTVVSRQEMKDAMAAQVDRIDYTNFKDSVADDARHDAYLSIWQTMLQWSHGFFNQRPKRRHYRPSDDYLDAAYHPIEK